MAEQDRNPQNTFDMLHGGVAPNIAARNHLFPRADFAQEVAAELGIDPARLESRVRAERPQVAALEQQSHSRGPT
jgi:tRNA A37 threonylcarbamoyltransferase TsaD